MSTTTVLDNEFLTMWYYPEDKIVHHKFHKFVFGQAFRDGLWPGADIFEKNKAQKWLSTIGRTSALERRIQTGRRRNGSRALKKARWKYWALVMPAKAIGQMNMQRFVKTYSDQGLTVKVFPGL